MLKTTFKFVSGIILLIEQKRNMMIRIKFEVVNIALSKGLNCDKSIEIINIFSPKGWQLQLVNSVESFKKCKYIKTVWNKFIQIQLQANNS